MRSEYNEEVRKAKQSAPDDQLCATPFGVDVVGITEFIALTGALVGGESAQGPLPARLVHSLCCRRTARERGLSARRWHPDGLQGSPERAVPGLVLPATQALQA